MNHRDIKGFFPLFVDLSDKAVVVIGAGAIAARRIMVLLDFCRDITVVAPKVSAPVEALAKADEIRLIRKKYDRSDLYGADLVLAATDDPEINSDIYSACKCLGITVNVCSDQSKCDFQFPGIVRQEEYVIGINGAGHDHRKVRRLKECVEETLKGGGWYD